MATLQTGRISSLTRKLFSTIPQPSTGLSPSVLQQSQDLIRPSCSLRQRWRAQTRLQRLSKGRLRFEHVSRKSCRAHRFRGRDLGCAGNTGANCRNRVDGSQALKGELLNNQYRSTHPAETAFTARTSTQATGIVPKSSDGAA